jgi:hypothetical protein
MSVLDLPPVPILLYRVQVIPTWEREWWAIPQDVVTALRLRDAEFYIHPAFCTGLEIEGWGVSVAGVSSYELSLIWRSVCITLTLYVGRRACAIARELGSSVAHPFLSLSRSASHAEVLAYQETYTDEAGWMYEGRIFEIQALRSPESEVPGFMLSTSEDALQRAMGEIARKMFAVGRGFGRLAARDGSRGSFSSDRLDLARRIWAEALEEHPRFVSALGFFSARSAAEQEFSYTWWHREVHILREEPPTLLMNESSRVPPLSLSSDEIAFGEIGGEP